MYGKIKSAQHSAFGELGNLGEALVRGIGAQVARDLATVHTDTSDLSLADRTEGVTASVIVSILPYPDQDAALDIIKAAMSVDLLPVVISDHRIQEARIAH